MGDLYKKLEANTGDGVAISGEFIHVRSCSNMFHIIVNGKCFSVDVGDQIRPAGGFQDFRIEETQGMTNTIEMIVDEGDYVQGKLVGEVTLRKSTNFTSTADVSLAGKSTTQILAVNSNRREAIISNLMAGSSARNNKHILRIPNKRKTLRIGDIDAGANRGVELAVGQSITLTTGAEIHAYNPSDDNCLVGVVEISD